MPNGIPALLSVSASCLPGLMIERTAYASKMDAASGDLVASEFIGGSTLAISGVALNRSTLWIAGSTGSADVPLSPNALTAPNLPSASGNAYLGAVDFTAPQRPQPRIDCVLNTADFTLAGPVAPYQELTIMGEGLGPASGVSAPNYSTTSLAGATVTFDSVPAPLLYVSSTQITLAVPAISLASDLPVMRVNVGNAFSAPRAFSLTYANPSLFLNFAETVAPSGGTATQIYPLALNADGSTNSTTNPAPLGSTISVFVNGLSPNPAVASGPVQLSAGAPLSGWSVVSVTPETPFELRVTLQVPTACPCSVEFVLSDITSYSVSQQVNIPSFGGIVNLAAPP